MVQYHERAVLADGHAVHFAVAKLGDGEAADDLRHVFTSDHATMASLTPVFDGQFAGVGVASQCEDRR